MSSFDDAEWSEESKKFNGTRPLRSEEPTTDVVIREGEEVLVEVPVGVLEFPDPKKREKSSVIKSLAKRFVDAVDDGDKPGVAARKIGMTLTEMRGSGDMAAAVKHLLDVGHVKAEIKKEVIRAGLFKTFVEGMMSDDKDAKRLALEAAKQMGGDPEIGLEKEQESSVTINLGALGESIKGVTIEGIRNPFKKENGSEKE